MRLSFFYSTFPERRRKKATNTKHREYIPVSGCRSEEQNTFIKFTPFPTLKIYIRESSKSFPDISKPYTKIRLEEDGFWKKKTPRKEKGKGGGDNNERKEKRPGKMNALL